MTKSLALLNLPKVADRHPARYTENLLPVVAEMVNGTDSVLDPFAGTGKIFRLRNYGFTGRIVAIELEPEWAAWHPETKIGNALALPFDDGEFGAVVTSPTYGNRMADHHEAKDESRRNTYRHALGRALQSENSGQLQWGDEYRNFHSMAWQEARRVIRPGGYFVLNIKDHIRAGIIQLVTQWHCDELKKLGFEMIRHEKIMCPGNRYGQNGNSRIDFESVIKFVKE